MRLQRISDTNGEKELSKFLDIYFYPRLKLNAGTVERKFDKESQYAGIDVQISNDTHSLNIDEKAALHYMDKDLKTFSFEIAFINEADNFHIGWLLDDTKKTNAYLLIYPKSHNTDLSTITYTEFGDMEVLLLRKDVIKDYLSSNGYTRDRLLWWSDYLRTNGYSGYHSGDNVPGLHFFLSDKLKEKPLNIIVNKRILESICTRMYRVSSVRLKKFK
jgi:hypothetical protein